MLTFTREGTNIDRDRSPKKRIRSPRSESSQAGTKKKRSLSRSAVGGGAGGDEKKARRFVVVIN